MIHTIINEGKKENVRKSVGETWNERLKECMDSFGYKQAMFAKKFRERYGTGSQSDVNRWLRVGQSIGKAGHEIGLPSYETMKRIADFFNVTVGYLTGETDYETFEMERTCKYLGINENAGKGIMSITKEAPLSRLDPYLPNDYRAALCYMLGSDFFKKFIDTLCKLASAKYHAQNPINYLNKAQAKINAKILDQALNSIDLYFEEEREDISIVTPELISAVNLLREAQDRQHDQEDTLKRAVSIAKYELFEAYIDLTNDILSDDHLSSMSTKTVTNHI